MQEAGITVVFGNNVGAQVYNNGKMATKGESLNKLIEINFVLDSYCALNADNSSIGS